MSVKLNGEKLEINPNKTLQSLIKETKETCRAEGEILTEIKVEGNSLTQSELEELADKKVEGKEIELSSETAEYISEEIIARAKEYLSNLSEWANKLEEIDDEMIEGLKEIPESLLWLNLALKELSPVQAKEQTIGGKKVNSLLNENVKFISELEEALKEPRENKQLIDSLVLRELPRHLEDYKYFFESLERETRRIA